MWSSAFELSASLSISLHKWLMLLMMILLQSWMRHFPLTSLGESNAKQQQQKKVTECAHDLAQDRMWPKCCFWSNGLEWWPCSSICAKISLDRKESTHWPYESECSFNVATCLALAEMSSQGAGPLLPCWISQSLCTQTEVNQNEFNKM